VLELSNLQILQDPSWFLGKHVVASVFVTAIVFLLKRARKDYGFSEHTEVSLKEGPALGDFDPCVLPAGRLAGAVEL
jgi:hypothetical protein